MLTKEALTRLGKVLAAGKLSAEQIKRLRETGALRSASRYTRGMHKGNLAIAEKLGLGDDVASLLKRKDRVLTGVSGKHYSLEGAPFSGAQLKQHSYVEPKEVIDFSGLFGGSTRPEVRYTGFGSGYAPPSGIFGRLKRFVRDNVDVAKEEFRRKNLGGFAGATDLSRDLQGRLLGRAFGADEGVRAVVNRHELDELREMLRLARLGKKGKTAFSEVYEHTSPRVLAIEARNVQTLTPEAKKRMLKLRDNSSHTLQHQVPREREYLQRVREAGGEYGVGGKFEIPDMGADSLLTKAYERAGNLKVPMA